MASQRKGGQGTTRATCLAAIRDLGEASVTDVSLRTGLSRPTVEAALARLADGGLVEHQVEQAQPGEAGGRPARLSRFRGDRGFVIGIDLSGATIHVRLADLAGRVVTVGETGHSSPSSSSPGLEVVTEVLDAALTGAGLTRRDLRAVGVGVAGLVRPDGTIVTSPSVSSWTGINLRNRLTNLWSLPVTVDNDLSLAAIGESRLGALVGTHTGVYVLTWHHVSARITIDGTVLRGRHDTAGEVGLLQSFSGIKFPPGPLTEATAAFADALDRLSLDAEDTVGKGALDELTAAMTPAVAALMLAVDPDKVVLGGALSRFADLIAPGLAASVNGFIEGSYGLDAVITGNDLGEAGVCVGAIHQAFESFAVDIYGTPGVQPPVLRMAQTASQRAADTADEDATANA